MKRRRRTVTNKKINYVEESDSSFNNESDNESDDNDEFIINNNNNNNNKSNLYKDMILKKSPAEFFAENQNIAGFDNAGKSLFTTIRELIENSLDACEAARKLPNVNVIIEKLQDSKFNELRGMSAADRYDMDLYAQETNKKKKKRRKTNNKDELLVINNNILEEKKLDQGKKSKKVNYFRVSCSDNGTGMRHDDIPLMLGTVLTSTKYGVKQTRGKFGLGAKMALVWAKKSTGLPIEIWSSTNGKTISYCKLDIDIYKNQPKIILHEHLDNSEKWIGTRIELIISGNWTTYRSKIIKYMRELAVITPYAEMLFEYISPNNKKSFKMEFSRRSEVMPPLPREVKHHPSSVNNLLVEQLIHHSRIKNGDTTLHTFLWKEFDCINSSLAKRLINELSMQNNKFTLKLKISQLNKTQIHQLTALLKNAKFPNPSGTSLSAAGEYNLRLGILKELEPDIVATCSMPAAVFEGHAFIVEAAIALGSKKDGKALKPGITVYRFANRIPLLFEQGSDVVSIVANKQIKWSSYKINSKQTSVSVFVSIVSTKIPFKGTSKEYIGDDNGIMNHTIKDALMNCCRTLRSKLLSRASNRERVERKKLLGQYIQVVGRSIISVLNRMEENKSDILPNDMNVNEINSDVIEKCLDTYIAKMDLAANREVSTNIFRGKREDCCLGVICNFNGNKYENDEDGFSIQLIS